MVTGEELRFAEQTFDVDGCMIRYRAAGSPSSPALLLVHGGQAHSGWWTFVGAALADSYFVLVPDLSGHGGSDRRVAYSADHWVSELATLAQTAAGRPVTAIGHSLGGKLAVLLAARRPDLVDGLILADTAVRAPGDSKSPSAARRSSTVYASKAEALRRFRLNPPETIADRTILAAMAEQSVMEVPGGWSWRADPRAKKVLSDAAVYAELAQVQCPVGVIYGERSAIVNGETVDRIVDILDRPVPSVVIDGGYHHVSLDDPDACLSAVQKLLSEMTLGR